MKIYYAPNTRAVRIVWLCEELSLGYELHKFDGLTDKRMREPDYLSVHPLGRVPCLEDDGQHIFESGAIVQYILARYGDGKLAPKPSSDEFANFLQWFHFAEGMLMPPVNTLVVETRILSAEKSNPTNIARAKKLLGRMLAAIEAGLGDKDYLIGDFTAADIMCGHAAIVAARNGGDIADKPAVTAYVKRLQARPALEKSWDID
tara:strand:- start:214 stop:825 length:612 start_codon:yes stop_codon:yes gene_type:complete